ncbi:MAG TPA: hypothetical protein VNZ53_04430 [Steroidobacteraceae bacterium]|jgi:hypothetical protein|nr:hypothetical protein [Steroidobacteraceae bacterium]
MNSSSQLSIPFLLDWPSWVTAIMANPQPSAAQQGVAQSILPGWVFGSVNITEQNSSDPDTERAIVASQSYGRQLGRIMDALALLIDDLPGKEREKEAFEEFTKLHIKINSIKEEAAARRLGRIAADLAALKKTSPKAYEHLAAKLRAVLDEP